MTEPRLKYRWDRTWPDSHDDYVAYDGDIKFGRVQLHASGPERVWLWAFWGDSIEVVGYSKNGAHPDKIEACRQLEAAYDERVAEIKRRPAAVRPPGETR